VEWSGRRRERIRKMGRGRRTRRTRRNGEFMGRFGREYMIRPRSFSFGRLYLG